MIAAALAGGILEAFTRVTWEKYWLLSRCRPVDILSKLNAENISLYERGVQGSYKYATFYANFAWAMLLLLIGRLYAGQKFCSAITFIIFGVVLLLLVASHIQWKYYVNYQNKMFGGANTHAGQ